MCILWSKALKNEITLGKKGKIHSFSRSYEKHAYNTKEEGQAQKSAINP